MKKNEVEQVMCHTCHKRSTTGTWIRIDRRTIVCQDCAPCMICARRKLVKCDVNCPKNAKQTTLGGETQ